MIYIYIFAEKILFPQGISLQPELSIPPPFQNPRGGPLSFLQSEHARKSSFLILDLNDSMDICVCRAVPGFTGSVNKLLKSGLFVDQTKRRNACLNCLVKD